MDTQYDSALARRLVILRSRAAWHRKVHQLVMYYTDADTERQSTIESRTIGKFVVREHGGHHVITHNTDCATHSMRHSSGHSFAAAPSVVHQTRRFIHCTNYLPPLVKTQRRCYMSPANFYIPRLYSFDRTTVARSALGLASQWIRAWNFSGLM